MRIVSGKARGTKLMSLDGMETRPTTDRVKESIFNIINSDIYDSEVLDLFSGSGALGIEAASRGAKKVVLVENNIKCRDVINKNVEKSKLTDIIDIVIGDAEVFIVKSAGKAKFDLIFMDPPYKKNIVEPILKKIVESNILSDDGIIVVEHSREDNIPENVGNLFAYKNKKYGITCVSIYRRQLND